MIQDGGSTDSSIGVIQSAVDRRRSWQSEADAGVYDAMNRALGAVDCDLVWFLNSGDTFHDNTVLTRVAESWVKAQWSWAYGSLIVRTSAPDVQHVYRRPRIYPNLVRLGLVTYPHPATVYGRKLINELGGYRLDLGVSADQDLCLRAAALSPPCFIDYPLSDFEPGGISTTNSAMEHEQAFRNFRRLRGEPILGSDAVDCFWARSMMLMRLAYARVRAGRG